MLGADVFEGFDYVALGHLHGPQNITSNIRYSGSPMAYSFGREEKQEKSVTIVDTDDMSVKIIPICGLRKRMTITGTYDELMAARFDEETLNGYVRLEVTDSYVGLDTVAAFRERYPNLLEIAGKSAEKEDAGITMTIEEFENASADPVSVFERYCEDTMEEKPGKHLEDMFIRSLRKYEKEATQT